MAIITFIVNIAVIIVLFLQDHRYMLICESFIWDLHLFLGDSVHCHKGFRLFPNVHIKSVQETAYETWWFEHLPQFISFHLLHS
jgi:hypothetical protein